jgi:hypothetical protein
MTAGASNEDERPGPPRIPHRQGFSNVTLNAVMVSVCQLRCQMDSPSRVDGSFLQKRASCTRGEAIIPASRTTYSLFVTMCLYSHALPLPFRPPTSDGLAVGRRRGEL